MWYGIRNPELVFGWVEQNPMKSYLCDQSRLSCDAEAHQGFAPTRPLPKTDSVKALPHNVSSDTIKDEKGQIASLTAAVKRT